VSFLCSRYGVSRSGFYAWQRRPNSRRIEEDRVLGEHIARVHRDSHGSYGSPRVQRSLEREGLCVSEKRVARLMRAAGLAGRASRVYRRLPGLHRFYEKIPNLRLAQPPPDGIDQVWVGDLTYIRVAGAWRYLAVVMDLYSRRLIGWAVSRTKSLAVTTRALQRAVAVRHPPPGLMFHSDRGVEYVAYAYQSLLKTHGITASLSRPYTCQDNAHMESFFHSLKAELLHRRDIHSDGQLNAMLAGYIERFYNSRRLHSSLGYYSPVEFEELMCSKQSVHKIG
jgi:transposase InsO family protein